MCSSLQKGRFWNLGPLLLPFPSKHDLWNVLRSLVARHLIRTKKRPQINAATDQRDHRSTRPKTKVADQHQQRETAAATNDATKQSTKACNQIAVVSCRQGDNDDC